MGPSDFFGVLQILRYNEAKGCNGWSSLTEKQCMEKCSSNARAKNCPQKTCTSSAVSSLPGYGGFQIWRYFVAGSELVKTPSQDVFRSLLDCPQCLVRGDGRGCMNVLGLCVLARMRHVTLAVLLLHLHTCGMSR